MTLSGREREDVEERKHPTAQVLYEAIRLEGQHELGRPASALALSGLAAGLSMGFSLLTMGLTRASLPDAPWTKLLVSLGYPVGFIIVITARQQLFTENTLLPVIPLLKRKDRATLVATLRLWSVVLAANLVGTLVFALALRRAGIFSDATRSAFALLATETLSGGFVNQLVRAVFSGWLIALMMWMLAGSESRAFVVVLITYLIGLAGLSHSIAGASEAFYAMFDGRVSLAECAFGFLVPVVLGNMIGGIALVAALNHAQVAADAKR